MTRVLIASYRDADNRKYKLYEDEEEGEWTVVSDSLQFAGTYEHAVEFLIEKGLVSEEPVEVTEDISEELEE